MYPAATDISSAAAHIINHGRPIISKWGGEWNNFQLHLKEEDWEKVYETLAKEMSCTVEEVRVSLETQYHSDVVAMRNTNNKLSFEEITFTMQSEWVNFPVAEIVYAYVGRMTTEEETWYVFEAESWESYPSEEEDAEVGVYPVMMLSKVEEDANNEDNRHFHYRYGDSVEELLAMKDWLPTMVYPWYSYEGSLELLRSHDRSAD